MENYYPVIKTATNLKIENLKEKGIQFSNFEMNNILMKELNVVWNKGFWSGMGIKDSCK